ncbi:hypothetical protein NKH82_17925 [Mesorhizobium sp. M0915]|uniref:hypothetical protein n=1 Tax=Mesorhizobium sp. M0915 TaxID=2957027 RepID=UPI003339AAF8
MADRVKKPMSPFEKALMAALTQKRLSYNPGIGAFETTTTQEFLASGWNGEYQWPVHKDPIFTPLFVAAGLSGSFQLFGATITYASIASAIATTAITVAVGFLLTPEPPKPEDGRQPLTQPIPYRFWGVGVARVSGAMMLWEVSGDKMFSVQAFVGHRINAYIDYYLNDDKVTVDTNGDVLCPEHNNRYKSRTFIYTRLGLVPETAYAELVTELGDNGVWTPNHRGDGQASAAMICDAPPVEDLQKVFPNGKPALSVVAELALCWDFRDPLQDPEDPSTWTFTKNPAIQLAWHECFSPFGTKRDWRKAILPVLDMWQEEADVCDEFVPRATGGFERRYECGGSDTAEHDPKGGTNAILAACDGWMCERGDGALLFVAGKFREKYVATLTDADILGHTIQHDVLPEEECNRLVPKFTYPATDYTSTDTDFWEDVPAQLQAGRVLPQDASYIWVQQWRQARRLAKREFARMRQKKRGSLDVRFTGINGIYAPWARLQTPLSIPSLNGKVINNRRSVLSIHRGGFQMTFIVMPPDIEEWNPETDEGAAPPIPPKAERKNIPVPVIDTILAVASAGSAYIRVVVIDPNRTDLTPKLRYRIVDTGDGDPGAWVEQKFPDALPEAGLIVMNTNTVPLENQIEVQAAFIGANGSSGEWTDSEFVYSTGIAASFDFSIATNSQYLFDV